MNIQTVASDKKTRVFTNSFYFIGKVRAFSKTSGHLPELEFCLPPRCHYCILWFLWTHFPLSSNRLYLVAAPNPNPARKKGASFVFVQLIYMILQWNASCQSLYRQCRCLTMLPKLIKINIRGVLIESLQWQYHNVTAIYWQSFGEYKGNVWRSLQLSAAAQRLEEAPGCCNKLWTIISTLPWIAARIAGRVPGLWRHWLLSTSSSILHIFWRRMSLGWSRKTLILRWAQIVANLAH